MSKECVDRGNCPAIKVCDAADIALSSLTEGDIQSDKTLMIRRSIVDLRRRVISSTAEVLSCEDVPEDKRQPLVCPLPLGFAENTTFGGPDDIFHMASNITNNSQMGFAKE